MKKMLSWMLTLIMILSLCGAAAAEETAAGFTLTPITWDGAGLGKVAVPLGFELQTNVECCTENTCLGSPLRVNALLVSETENAAMSFYANETYLQRVKSSYSQLKHVNGQLDGQTMVFMLEYMNAEQYCNTRAQLINQNAQYYASEDMSHFDSMLEAHKKYFSDQILPGMAQYGMTADWLEITADQRVYTFESDGVTWACCVMAEVRGYQYSMMNGREVCVLWDVPGFYSLLCPLESYRRIHDTLFVPFVENTAVSDTFYNLQDQLTEQIRDDTIQQWNMQIAASNAYAAAMNAFTSASVESYLNQSSYSSVDRFSDYIFDQNTYATDDGHEVSISTAYDYVWAGDNGVVYYSDSPSAMPYGATQLSPIR